MTATTTEYKCEIAGFLADAFCKACNHFVKTQGSGLVSVERLEKAYAARKRHLLAKFSFANLLWWLSVSNPADIQEELESGWLSSEKDVRIVFGRSRTSLWEWAEMEREAWMESVPECLEWVTYVARSCPIQQRSVNVAR